MVQTLEISPDSRWLAAAGPESRITIWDLQRGTLIRSLSGALNSYNSVKFSPDGRRAFAGGNPGTLSVWDTSSTNTLQNVGVFRGHLSGAGVGLLPGTEEVVSVGWEGMGRCALRVWRAPSLVEIDAYETTQPKTP
jgi:WD40 repeat protein